MKDVHFCSINASACYTEISQETSDCLIPCTGLYADVVFTEDKILDTKTPFSGRHFGDTIKIYRDETDQGRERQKLILLLKKYTNYKKSFVKQIKFDPLMFDLSKYISVKKISFYSQCQFHQMYEAF